MLKILSVSGAMLDTAQGMGIHSLTDPQTLRPLGSARRRRGHAVGVDQRLWHPCQRGALLPPVALLEVRTADGKILEKFDPARARADSVQNPPLTAQQAYVITDILSDNEARAPLFGLTSALHLSRPAAAKTGTTNDYKDSWTLGYSPDLVTGVWVEQQRAAMAKVAGSRGAGPIWHNFMEGVLNDPEMEARSSSRAKRTPPVDFPKPPNLVRVPVCTPSGLKPSAACPQVHTELFIAGTEPTAEDNLWKMFKVYIGPEDVKDPELAGPDCAPDSTVDRPFLASCRLNTQAWARPIPAGRPAHPGHPVCAADGHAHGHAGCEDRPSAGPRLDPHRDQYARCGPSHACSAR